VADEHDRAVDRFQQRCHRRCIVPNSAHLVRGCDDAIAGLLQQGDLAVPARCVGESAVHEYDCGFRCGRGAGCGGSDERCGDHELLDGLS
jgi:hypothetical protein